MEITDSHKTMNLEQIINSNPGIFGLLTFLAGLLLGNWLAIGRDRRREFNEIADEIYSILLHKKEGAAEKLVWPGPTDDQIQNLIRRTPFWRKSALNKAVNIYARATDQSGWQQDSVGQPFYREPEKVVNAINGLLKYVNRK